MTTINADRSATPSAPTRPHRSAPGDASHAGVVVALRLAAFTTWLALVVPLVGILEVAFITMGNDSIGSADPAAATAFIGGLALGLALWTLSMLVVLRQNRHRVHVDRFSIWKLLAVWLPALAVWFALREALSGGAAAVAAVLTLLVGWLMVWRAAAVALR